MSNRVSSWLNTLENQKRAAGCPQKRRATGLGGLRDWESLGFVGMESWGLKVWGGSRLTLFFECNLLVVNHQFGLFVGLRLR